MNGVDTHIFKPISKCRNLQEKFSLDPKKLVVGYVGTHGACQDLETIIYVAQKFSAIESVHFVFIGDGCQKLPLMKLSNRLKLKNISFFDPVVKNMMPSVWSILDIVLVTLKNKPTFSTVVPSKLFEAMAMGRCVLLMSPVGEASHLVLDSKCAAHIESENIESLYNQLYKMAQDEELRKLLSTSALNTCKLYTRERQAKQFILDIVDFVNANQKNRSLV